MDLDESTGVIPPELYRELAPFADSYPGGDKVTRDTLSRSTKLTVTFEPLPAGDGTTGDRTAENGKRVSENVLKWDPAYKPARRTAVSYVGDEQKNEILVNGIYYTSFH